jgi:hypothetical protein
VLAPPLLVTGLWAVVTPEAWFEHFPGLGPQLVAAEPPFNAHLATDAGAGFLAIGVALLAAGLWARRSAVYLALLAYLISALSHLIYHAANPAPGLSHTAQVINIVLLASGVSTGAVLTWGTRTKPTQPARAGSHTSGRRGWFHRPQPGHPAPT